MNTIYLNTIGTPKASGGNSGGGGGDVPSYENGVYIQHKVGKLFTTDDWTALGFSNDLANGVAVITDAARFVIAKGNVSASMMQWASDTSTLIDGVLTSTDGPELKADFAGKQNTEFMLTVDTSGAGYSCANYTFPNGEKGYLPALGEWGIAYQNKAAIDKVMTLIGGTALGSTALDGKYYWSSTQYSASKACYHEWDNGTAGYGNKTAYRWVRAFSALSL